MFNLLYMYNSSQCTTQTFYIITRVAFSLPSHFFFLTPEEVYRLRKSSGYDA